MRIGEKVLVALENEEWDDTRFRVSAITVHVKADRARLAEVIESASGVQELCDALADLKIAAMESGYAGIVLARVDAALKKARGE